METNNLPTGNKVKKFWNNLGPGLTTGAADDDPSGITTYSQSGAAFGFNFLWLALLTFPFMVVVQEMCARIGLVTGRGLASAIKVHISKKVLYVCALLLFVTNTINIAANLGIMVKAVQLLLPALSSFLLVLLFISLILVFQILVSYKKYSQVLKWTSLVLLVYVLTAFTIKVDWLDVLSHTFWPRFGLAKDQLLILTAVLGTTISPYLFFWQTSQEVEEQIMEGKKTIKARAALTTPEEISRMRKDTWLGMLLSNVVMFFIIVVCAVALNQNGIFEITDAGTAASVLRPLAGEFAYLLFTIGIIGTGMLAIPILAGSSSYALAETFGWREGLYRKFKQAHAFYGVIIVSVAMGLVLHFLDVNVIKLLIYTAVLNGLIAPIILALIVKISSSRKIMKEWTNRPAITFLGWGITALMGGVALLTIVYLIY